MSFELELCELTILDEIANPQMTRRDVAMTYRLILQQTVEKVDWNKINRAIIDRWSRAGLEWIKERAWREKPLKTILPKK